MDDVKRLGTPLLIIVLSAFLTKLVETWLKGGQVIGVGAGQQRVRGHVRPHLACERPVRHRASRVRLASARSDGLLRRASVRPPGVKKPLRGSGEAFNCGRFA